MTQTEKLAAQLRAKGMSLSAKGLHSGDYRVRDMATRQTLFVASTLAAIRQWMDNHV